MSFHDDLKFSEDDGNSRDWHYIYKHIFGHSYKREAINQKSAQLSGVDETVSFWHNKILTIKWIERKTRRPRNNIKYDDILLEIISNDNSNTPGWAVKTNKADYIFYFNRMVDICYMMHAPTLRNFLLNNDCFVQNKRKIASKNESYQTINIAVNYDELQQICGGKTKSINVALLRC